jgi:hypothetical protein
VVTYEMVTGKRAFVVADLSNKRSHCGAVCKRARDSSVSSRRYFLLGR